MAALLITLLCGCNKEADGKITVTLAAAASLEKIFSEELIPRFTEKNPDIVIEGTYDSSGKLQAQIEEGLAADVFMSAAMKQMNTLVSKGFIKENSIIELLENRIVLVTGTKAETQVKAFADIILADTIAVGDPESVPAGQYAKEICSSLGIWEEVEKRASLGTNVTEVLNWVAEGSAEAGIVYATDAASSDKVRVVCGAPEGCLKERVIYPVGICSETAHLSEAERFVRFLQTEEALAVFEDYGFSVKGRNGE